MLRRQACELRVMCFVHWRALVPGVCADGCGGWSAAAEPAVAQHRRWHVPARCACKGGQFSSRQHCASCCLLTCWCPALMAQHQPLPWPPGRRAAYLLPGACHLWARQRAAAAGGARPAGRCAGPPGRCAGPPLVCRCGRLLLARIRTQHTAAATTMPHCSWQCGNANCSAAMRLGHSMPKADV